MCKSFVGVMKKHSPHFHPLIFTLLNKNESFCSKHAQKRLNVAIRAAHKLTLLLLLRIVQISKIHVQGVKNFCFSSLNMQMCNVLFAIVAMVTCVPHYSSVKLSWALLAVITVPKNMCIYISLDDLNISGDSVNNSVFTTKFTIDFLGYLIFYHLLFVCLFF